MSRERLRVMSYKTSSLEVGRFYSFREMANFMCPNIAGGRSWIIYSTCWLLVNEQLSTSKC